MLRAVSIFVKDKVDYAWAGLQDFDSLLMDNIKPVTIAPLDNSQYVSTAVFDPLLIPHLWTPAQLKGFGPQCPLLSDTNQSSLLVAFGTSAHLIEGVPNRAVEVLTDIEYQAMYNIVEYLRKTKTLTDSIANLLRDKRSHKHDQGHILSCPYPVQWRDSLKRRQQQE